MHVTDENINTMSELMAFIDGALEAAENESYWLDLSSRTNKILTKMISQRDRQNLNSAVKKAVKAKLNPNL